MYVDEFLVLSHQNNNLGSSERVLKSPRASGALMAPKHDFLGENLRNSHFCLILAVFTLPEPSQCPREGYLSTHVLSHGSKKCFRCFSNTSARLKTL